jgi:LytS/YehU family sensor histidine kinase
MSYSFLLPLSTAHMIKDFKIRKELDPHFFLNSFTTLSHLIHADAGKAYLFNNKLAQVYKYFLLNKERELVALEDELQFIEDYFFLLRVRHDDKLNWIAEVLQQLAKTTRVIPFSLQFLVDHAIRHNQFSAVKPLNLVLKINDDWIEITNSNSEPININNEKETGLRDLNDRYQKIATKGIAIQQNGKEFTVKIPVIHQYKS